MEKQSNQQNLEMPAINYINRLPQEIYDMIFQHLILGETIEATTMLEPTRFGALFVDRGMRDAASRAIARYATIRFVCQKRRHFHQTRDFIWKEPRNLGEAIPYQHTGSTWPKPQNLILFPLPDEVRNILIRLDLTDGKKFSCKSFELNAVLQAITARCSDQGSQNPYKPGRRRPSIFAALQRLRVEEQPVRKIKGSGQKETLLIYPCTITAINPRLTVTVEFSVPKEYPSKHSNIKMTGVTAVDSARLRKFYGTRSDIHIVRNAIHRAIFMARARTRRSRSSILENLEGQARQARI